MKEQRSVRRGRGKQVIAWVVGVATALGAGTPVLAQAPTFGIVGLSGGQVAFLNMVITDQPAANHPGCQVTASFVDERGRVFVDSKGKVASGRFTLKPQIANTLTLSADMLTDGRQRRRIRAVVALASTIGAPSNCTCFIGTQELVNQDGRTALVDYGVVETPQLLSLAQPRDPCSPPSP